MDVLSQLVYSAGAINEFYLWRMTRGLMPIFMCLRDDNLPGEQWRGCPGCPDVWVSNLGRIKIGGTIAPQFEMYADKIGYLGVEIDGKGCMVYRLVARAWGLTPDDYDTAPPYPDADSYVVHHKSNDGYDNRPANLVVLRKSVHDKISHSGNGLQYPSKELADIYAACDEYLKITK